MRIGIITHNFPRTSKERGDAGIFVYDFAKRLSKYAKVFVLSPDFQGAKESYKDFPVTWFDWGGGGEKFGDWKLCSLSSLPKFFQLIIRGKKASVDFAKNNRLDFCLACWALPSAVYANQIKKKLGIPYATWSLGSDLNKYANIPILREFIKEALKNSNLLFANSYLLCKKGKKLSGKNFSFLPAVTDFDGTNIKPVKIKDDTTNFLFVGRLEKVKGIDILIRASQALRHKVPTFSLYIIGDGSMYEFLSKKIKKSGAKNIFLLGKKSKEVVASYMKASDFLVIPSRSESLPLVVIEAAKANLSVIAAGVGDLPRLIKTYKIGKVVPKEDPEKLAKSMLYAVNNEEIKEKYRKGLKKMAKDFSLDASVKKFLEETKNL